MHLCKSQLDALRDLALKLSRQDDFAKHVKTFARSGLAAKLMTGTNIIVQHAGNNWLINERTPLYLLWGWMISE